MWKPEILLWGAHFGQLSDQRGRGGHGTCCFKYSEKDCCVSMVLSSTGEVSGKNHTVAVSPCFSNLCAALHDLPSDQKSLMVVGATLIVDQRSGTCLVKYLTIIHNLSRMFRTRPFKSSPILPLSSTQLAAYPSAKSLHLVAKGSGKPAISGISTRFLNP